MFAVVKNFETKSSLVGYTAKSKLIECDHFSIQINVIDCFFVTIISATGNLESRNCTTDKL